MHNHLKSIKQEIMKTTILFFCIFVFSFSGPVFGQKEFQSLDQAISYLESVPSGFKVFEADGESFMSLVREIKNSCDEDKQDTALFLKQLTSLSRPVQFGNRYQNIEGVFISKDTLRVLFKDLAGYSFTKLSQDTREFDITYKLLNSSSSSEEVVPTGILRELIFRTFALKEECGLIKVEEKTFGSVFADLYNKQEEKRKFSFWYNESNSENFLWDETIGQLCDMWQSDFLYTKPFMKSVDAINLNLRPIKKFVVYTKNKDGSITLWY
jgi:hypothetical protein